MRCRSAIVACAVAWSSCPVGSSARRSRGRLAIARASATRWACPPESSSGSLSASSARPNRASSAFAAARASRPLPSDEQRQADVLGDVQRRHQARCLERDRDVAGPQVIARARGSASGTSRLSADRAPANRCSSVDLPLPDGPMIAIRALGADHAGRRAAAPRSARRRGRKRAATLRRRRRALGRVALSHRPVFRRGGASMRSAARPAPDCGSRQGWRRPRPRVARRSAMIWRSVSASTSAVGSSQSRTAGRSRAPRRGRRVPPLRRRAVPAGRSSGRAGRAGRHFRDRPRRLVACRQPRCRRMFSATVEVVDEIARLQEHADVAGADGGARSAPAGG